MGSCDSTSEGVAEAEAEASGDAESEVGTTGTLVSDASAADADADCSAPLWIWNVPLRPTWVLPSMKRIWAPDALASGVKVNEPSELGTCAIVCHCPFTWTWIWTLAGSLGECCCQRQFM